MLVGTDVTDDVLVGYPTADRGALFRLVQDEQLAATVTIMVDDVAQLDLIDAVTATPARDRAGLHRARLLVATGQRPAAHRGSALSAAHTRVPRPVGHDRDRPGWVRLVGIMAYESQIAGVPDQFPGRTTYGQIVRWMKRRSARELLKRRAAAVEAVRTVADVEFVNGGGTGSLDRTAGEDVITEVAAGSGLLAPRLFDRYRSFSPQPASFFALPVVRRPAAQVVTVLGGGYVASGAAGPDRLPVRGFRRVAPRSGRRRRRSADPATWSGRGRAGHRRLGVVPARQGRRARGTVRAHVSGPR